MENMEKTLSDLISRRKRLFEGIGRLEGRKEEAESNLARVEQECRDFGVDPENLEKEVHELELECKSKLEALCAETDSAEAKILPHLEELDEL